MEEYEELLQYIIFDADTSTQGRGHAGLPSTRPLPALLYTSAKSSFPSSVRELASTSEDGGGARSPHHLAVTDLSSIDSPSSGLRIAPEPFMIVLHPIVCARTLSCTVLHRISRIWHMSRLAEHMAIVPLRLTRPSASAYLRYDVPPQPGLGAVHCNRRRAMEGSIKAKGLSGVCVVFEVLVKAMSA